MYNVFLPNKKGLDTHQNRVFYETTVGYGDLLGEHEEKPWELPVSSAYNSYHKLRKHAPTNICIEAEIMRSTESNSGCFE